MAIATPGNHLTEFAVAAMDAVEEGEIETFDGMTNAVEDPTEFIVWVRTGASKDDYITVRVTFEELKS